jgi:hypothetical protein
MDAWVELAHSEYNRVWDRFYRDFEFRPSIYPEDFPGIREPVPSVTYALPRVDGEIRLPTPGDTDDLHAAMLAAFRTCTPSGGRIYALDWQHTSYYLAPRAAFEEWLIPILPDGDYYIFLAQDFSWGMFGHPWEWTICAFGTPLFAALKQRWPRLFDTPIRQSGATTEKSS